MDVTVARLYHPAPWGWLYSYRIGLVLLRMLELEFKAARYLFFRAPLLIAWTRLPGLRDKRPPYSALAEILAPPKGRPSLLVGEGQLGSHLETAKSAPEIAELAAALRKSQSRPSRLWSLVGSVMRGYYTELGPAFIKFGQIMSMREEVPPSIRRELQLLQDKLPPMSYKEVRKILERELARPVEEVFEWVEEKPIAAASLAQVYRAKLRHEQEEVALKIQRPHLDGMITLDTVIICDVIVRAIQLALPLFRKNTDPKAFTSSYRKSLKREVDFVLEGRTQDDWRHRIERHPLYRQIYKIAKTYPEYTTGKLLTMELIRDYYRFDRMFDDLTPEEIQEVVNTRVEGFPPDLPLQLVYTHALMAMETMARWDITHGDLHMGNFYLLKPQSKEDRWRVFLCDFGMMIESPGEEREWLADMLAAIMYHRSGDKLVDAFAKSGAMAGMDEASIDELRRLGRIVVQNYVVPVEEGKEAVLHGTWQRSTRTNLLTAAMYQYAQMGVRWSDWWWLVMKNIDYCLNTGATLSTTINWSEGGLIAVRWWIREQVLRKLEGKDITILEESLEEILEPLRDYDRKQVLRGLLTGEEVKPLERSWVHGRDTRFGIKK